MAAIKVFFLGLRGISIFMSVRLSLLKFIWDLIMSGASTKACTYSHELMLVLKAYSHGTQFCYRHVCLQMRQILKWWFRPIIPTWKHLWYAFDNLLSPLKSIFSSDNKKGKYLQKYKLQNVLAKSISEWSFKFWKQYKNLSSKWLVVAIVLNKEYLKKLTDL